MTTENRIPIYLRPEIQSALDAMATATRRTRSEVISSLIEHAPLVRTVKACRNCGHRGLIIRSPGRARAISVRGHVRLVEDAKAGALIDTDTGEVIQA